MKSPREEGVVRIAIDDDPERVISFVPDDILFTERFYDMLDSIKRKEAAYQERLAVLAENKATDELGIPENARESIALLREVCDFMRDEIDAVFGEGTSEKAFGEYRSLLMIEGFFKGIIPYMQTARQKLTSKYTDPVIEKRRKIEQEKARKAK